MINLKNKFNLNGFLIKEFKNKKPLNKCKEIFEKKTIDYGTAWRILRPQSLTDQIFIKAKRIRSIEVSNENAVGESLDN